MRHVPDLRFEADRSTQHAIRIGELLEQVVPGDEPDDERRAQPE